MRSLYLTVICLCFLLQTMQAQTSYGPKDSVETLMHSMDTSTGEEGAVASDPDITGDTTLYIHSLPFPKDTITYWRNSKDYAYMAYIDSLLHARKNAPEKVEQQHGDSVFDSVLTSPIMKAILWLMAAGFVIFIVYRLFLNKGIFVRSSASSAVSGTEDEILPETITDFDAGIADALARQDYRQAVRFHFLKTLKQLSDRGDLQPGAEKTNYEYVREISPDKRMPFSKLVMHYEYVWYGGIMITENQYRLIVNDFKNFM